MPLLALAASPAAAGCPANTNVAVVTCSGDVSGGVSVSNSVTTKLEIKQVTTDITPAAGQVGIVFVPTSATIDQAVLRSDLSKSPGGQDRFRITVSGSLADGITASGRARALLVDSTGDIRVTSTGLTAQNDGIEAAITRTVAGAFDNKVYSKGDISVLTASPSSYGIKAKVDNGNSPTAITGAIRVESTGDITATKGTGILAGDNAVRPNMAVTADITVISRGNITAGSDGIVAAAAKGSISITSEGNIVSGRLGINADCVNCSGDVTVLNTGDITITGGSSDSSISAQTKGKTTVISTGALSRGARAGSELDAYVSNNGTVSAFGLSASSSFGKAEIRTQGDITDPVIANGNQGASVENKGNIVNVGSSSLAAYTSWGRAVVTNTDSRSNFITSGEIGITGGAINDATIEITNRARIEAYYRGIATNSREGLTKVTNTGVIEATEFSGIRLYSYSSGSLQLTNSAAVTGGSSGIVLQTKSGDVIIEQTGGAVTANKPPETDPEKKEKLPLICNEIGGAAICATTGEAGTVNVTAENGVFALTAGVFARTDQGALTVSVSGGIAGAGGKANATKGIDAVSVSGDVAVTSIGNIAVYDTGINASSTSGKVSVSSTGNVTSLNGAGIAVAGSAAAEVSITSDGRVQSSLAGIEGSASDGKLSIVSKGAVTSSAGKGILAQSTGLGLVDVKSDAAVTGGDSGIFATAATTNVSIVQKGGAVTATGGLAGIYAKTGGTGIVTVTADSAVLSAVGGVVGRTDQGALTVSVSGGIAGAGGKANAAKGIDAVSVSGDVAVTSIGDIAVYDTGINASSTSGKVTVSSTGNVTSLNGAGIAVAGSAAAEVSITSDGRVQSKLTGIEGSASDGKLSIVSKGAVTSSDGKGILAQSTGLGLVDVKSDAAVTGGDSGIFATAATTNVSIVQKGGAVTATGGLAGIYAKTGGTGIVTVTADSSILSAVAGVVARTGQGALTVTITGGIAGAGGKANATKGIDAVSASGDVAVTSVGNIAIYDTGINASSTSGKVSVSSTGNVTSLNGAGIAAASSAAAEVSITSDGLVQSRLTGIEGSASDGKLSIVSKGAVISSAGKGILTQSTGLGLVDVRSYAAVTGGDSGIFATAATANVSVAQKNGAVTATGGLAGIYAKTGGTGVVTVTADSSILSAVAGVVARTGQGALTVSVSGGIAGAGGKANATKGIDAVSASGDVAVTSIGNIAVYDTGINASSTSGKVTVSSTGNVTSLNGAGIVARGGAAPVSVSAQGDVSSSLNSAIVVEGLGALSVKATGVTQGAIAGVEFGDSAPGLDGTANSLEITATANVRNTSADLARLAIWGRAGAETVVNSGTVTGSVDLGGGADSFLNRTSALFVTGTQVMLGDGETLTNEGNLNIGGGANLLQTSLTGNVSQTADGVFLVDFKPDSAPANRASDVLVLTGNANLSGTVVASQWAGTKVNAEQQFVILETSGGVVTTSGLALSIAPTPGYVASLEVLNNGTQLVLKFTATEPTPPPEPPTEIVPDWAVAAALSALNFSGTLIGCPRESGSYAAIGEGQCLWMDSGGGYLDGDAANGNPGWDQTSWWIGGGGQVALSDVIRLGASVRYEDSSLDSGDNASTSGALWNAGAALTYTSGPVLLAAAASAGWSTLDTHRETSAGGKVTADHDLGYAHAKLRAGYLVEYGQWYLKPLIDFDATWMSYGDFSEKGGGAGAVKADSEEDTLLSASPRLEIGGDIALENGVLLRPFLRAGATVFDDTGFGLGWRYLAGPADEPAYEARAELDQVMADVSAGVDIFGMNGLSARLYYDGSFGETIHSHAGGFTARMEF